jgi:hypothetical protein
MGLALAGKPRAALKAINTAKCKSCWPEVWWGHRWTVNWETCLDLLPQTLGLVQTVLCLCIGVSLVGAPYIREGLTLSQELQKL